MDGVELIAYLDGCKLYEESEITKQDYLNYYLGKYVAFAFNDPSKYPKEPFFKDIEQKAIPTEQTVDEQVNVLKLWMMALGGKEIDNG